MCSPAGELSQTFNPDLYRPTLNRVCSAQPPYLLLWPESEVSSGIQWSLTHFLSRELWHPGCRPQQAVEVLSPGSALPGAVLHPLSPTSGPSCPVTPVASTKASGRWPSGLASVLWMDWLPFIPGPRTPPFSAAQEEMFSSQMLAVWGWLLQSLLCVLGSLGMAQPLIPKPCPCAPFKMVARCHVLFCYI